MEDFFKDLEAKLRKKSRILGNHWGCIVWEGYAEKNGYGIQMVKWPDKGIKKERAHRVAYMIKHKLCANDMPKLDENSNPLECSHLCHNKLCVNPDHITLENHATNQERIHCKGQGHCSKCHEPHCLLCTNFIYKFSCSHGVVSPLHNHVPSLLISVFCLLTAKVCSLHNPFPPVETHTT